MLCSHLIFEQTILRNYIPSEYLFIVDKIDVLRNGGLLSVSKLKYLIMIIIKK